MKKFYGVLAVLTLAVSLAQARLTGTDPGNDAFCVGPSGAEVCVDASGNLLPTTTNDTTLGSSSLYWSFIYSYDLTLSDDLIVGDDLTVTGDASVAGNTTIGDNYGDYVDMNAGTMYINATSIGFQIGTASDDAAWIMTFSGDGTTGARKVCINCTSGAQNNDSALLIIGDGLRLGTGNTPAQTIGADDMFVEGTVEIDGDIDLGGSLAMVGSKILINDDATGMVIGTHTSDSAWILAMGGTGTAGARSICINCVNAAQNNDSALLVIGDGLRVGTGSTPLQAIGEDDMYVEGTVEIVGNIIAPSPATELILSGATIIATNACGGIKSIYSYDNKTTDTTNTFTEPKAHLAGCILHVVNTGTMSITLDANANFKVNAGVNVILRTLDAIIVGCNGTYWYALGSQSFNS